MARGFPLFLHMKIMFVSLGCDKNLVDTEMMLGMLADKGYEFTEDEHEAEVIVVNTCSFIRDAKMESIETLIEMGALKKEGKLRALICAGCLAQRYTDEIRQEIPEVDAIVGTMSIDAICQAVEESLGGLHNTYKASADAPLVYGKRRIVTTGGHFAYLKIAEGCNKRCTYCAIPGFRGKYRSVPIEVLEKEAQKLADDGVRELILVAQETTLYGVDLYQKKSLPDLLDRLNKISGLYRIRILYCYPEEIDDGLIDAIKRNDKVVHYLDMPIQHISDKVLKRMGRRTTKESITDTIAKLRREIPDICLRTTLITGFPGESHKDFKILYDWVSETKFDRLGVFTYSREENTKAAEYNKQVPEPIKKIRRNKIMKIQQQIAYKQAIECIGREMTVMIEGRMPEDNVYVARTYKDAPNVDGFLFVETAKELMTGDFIKVKVTGAKEYDLIGVPTDEFTE